LALTGVSIFAPAYKMQAICRDFGVFSKEYTLYFAKNLEIGAQ
jgi:hypothetical protein